MADRWAPRPPDSVYNPPNLPSHLKNVYELKRIVGVPTDEEVKGIHAVLRAAHNAAQIPGMYDPDLSKDLAEYMFDIQMARYCRRYSFGVFLQDIVHEPPALPSHISITLKPVVGIPSGEEFKSVHAAVRTSENLASIPGMFDADLNMHLSEHLFDIQIARYLERSMRRRFGSGDTPSDVRDLPAVIAQPQTSESVESEILPAPLVALESVSNFPPSGANPRCPLSESLDILPELPPEPLAGENRILLGINIGMTQTSVAIAFIQNGVGPQIHCVSMWPGTEASSSHQLPSLVWYDQNKNAVSFGAEALCLQTKQKGETEGWSLAKHFPFHMLPNRTKTQYDRKLDTYDLPDGVSLRQIYTDFMRYLFKHTQAYFEAHIIDGKHVWERYQRSMEVVIVHPNGWGLLEQALLGTAAANINPYHSLRRIQFVTESEASAYFCLHHTNLELRTGLQSGITIAVCDAGKYTVTATLHLVISTHPALRLKKKRASACVQAGENLVDLEVEQHLRKALTDATLSQEDVNEYCKTGLKSFDTSEKWGFHNEEMASSIAIGPTSLNKPAVGIRRGRMTLSGSTIKSFFDPCFRRIISCVDSQLKHLPVTYIFPVGRIWDSPYLRTKFQNRYNLQGYEVVFANQYSLDAASQGAIIWNIISGTPTSHTAKRGGA